MSYESVPGTVPHKVILYLRGMAQGAEISITEAASMLGMESARGLRAWLQPAVNGGALFERRGGARMTFYRLGDGIDRPALSDDPQVTKIGAMAVSSIFAYAEERRAAPFSTAESSDGRIILQRHGRVIAELTPDEAQAHREFLAKRGQWEMQE